MRNMKILVAMGLLTAAHVASAEVSGSIGLVSDYDYRGWTQTDNGPAIQGSIDYAHESGWYIGTWATNIDHFSDGGSRTATTEIDLYTGFSGETEGGLGWDVGLLYYMYPNASDLNFAEIYASLSYSIATVGVAYSDAFAHKDNDSAFYVYGDVSVPVGPVSLDFHAGHSTGDGIQDAYGFASKDSYQDYSIGLSYTANNVTLGLKWVALDAGSEGSDDRFLVSVSTSLPWGD
jgi:uncharacterized protein (TIGR02001 family)